MTTRTRHCGKLRIIEKLRHSTNGNPRYLVAIDGYVARTIPNSQLGYTITNYNGKQVEAILRDWRGKLHIESVHTSQIIVDNKVESENAH